MQEEVFKRYQAKQEGKQKALYESFMTMVEKDRESQYIMPNTEGAAMLLDQNRQAAPEGQKVDGA